ncbi:MAG: hypothetical protein ABL962_11645 [Fimbriimonadaceae bacterium]
MASAKVMHKPGSITEDDRKWWAYQPVRRPEVPGSLFLVPSSRATKDAGGDSQKKPGTGNR